MTGKIAEAGNVELFSVEYLMQILVINAEGGRYYKALIDVLSKYVFEFIDGSALQRGICAYHSFHTNIHTYLNEFYMESYNCCTVPSFSLPQAPLFVDLPFHHTRTTERS